MIQNKYTKNFFQRSFLLLFGFCGFFLLRLWINGFQAPIFNENDNFLLKFNENIFLKILNQIFLWLLNLKLLLNPLKLCFDYSNGCIEPIEGLNDKRCIYIILSIFAILLFFGANLKLENFNFKK